VLVVSLLVPPAAGLAQPQSPQEPRAPAIPAPQAPPPVPQAPPVDFPVRAPGGAATAARPDPCGAFGVNRVQSPDYRLGSGDLLDVQIAGRLDVTRQQVVVDPEGTLTIPPIGSIDVAGVTLREANRRVGERAKTLLRFADVSISVQQPRCFEVILSGEIERPGSVQSSALRRVHDVLLAAGGITPRGSLRRVVVTRAGAEATIDLLRFELTGEVAENPMVEEGMKIHVPPRAGSITLTGAFRRPGEYEIGPDGGLRQLLALTGGITQTGAAAETRLTRLQPDGRKETISVDLRSALTPPADVPLRPGDVIFVPPLAVLQDVVEVRGAFNGTAESSRTTTTGKATIVQRFELAQGDRVKDMIGRAGGAAAYADLRLAVVERAALSGPRQRIPIDLQRLLVEKDDSQNIVLENGDVLTVPVAEDRVYVLGEVRNPGAVDFRPDLTPREYVSLAGGPTVRARFKNATVTYRNGKSFLLAEAPPLEPGAVVTVPEVSVRWYQDYVTIASTITSLITAYTGLFILFGGRIPAGND
jgi:protein involved in polysaccharide export with SLBB domain